MLMINSMFKYIERVLGSFKVVGICIVMDLIIRMIGCGCINGIDISFF